MPVASELLVKVNADVSNLTSGLNQADKQVSGFAKSAGALGSVATAGFIALGAAAVGLGAGIASSVSKAIDFQQGIADVGVTRGVLLLASATGTDVAEAAQIAGDSFNIFRKSLGLTAKDMPKIADLFTGVANVSSISLQDLGESMKYIGPVAASMGISLEDVTAAIAELGNQGIKGSQAGTSLRSIISSLAKPSKQAQKAMNDLGLEFFDTNGKMKDFAGISGELQSKLSGLTDEQRAATLVTLFGNEALSAANVLYGEGSEGIQKYIKDIAAQGNAAAIGAQRNNTLRGSIENFKGALETAQITLGKAFLPLLKSLTDQATGAVQAAIPLIEHWGPKLAAGLQTGIGKLAEFGGAVRRPRFACGARSKARSRSAC
jgi:TP901 family phage tail tape measure protein